MTNAPKDPKSTGTGNTKPETGAKEGKGWVKTGVAVGIGSAAIVAALLYANRSKTNKKS